MALAKIKKEYQTTVVAFGKSGLPLGERDDIDALAIIAHESGNKNLIKLFELLPPLSDLKKGKVESELASVSVTRKSVRKSSDEQSKKDNAEQSTTKQAAAYSKEED